MVAESMEVSCGLSALSLSSQTTACCADVKALFVLSPRGAVSLTALFQM